MAFKKHIKAMIVLEVFTISVISLNYLHSIKTKSNEMVSSKVISPSDDSLLNDFSMSEAPMTLYESTDGENKIFRLTDNEVEDKNTEDDKSPDLSQGEEKEFIKWVDFNVDYEALTKAYEYDLETYEKDIHVDWIELLAYIAAKNGGTISSNMTKELTAIAESIIDKTTTMEALTRDLKYYNYYLEAYTAILGGYVGDYEVELFTESTAETGTTDQSPKYEKKYGLKAFSPIAKGFPYSDFDDFGVSRSYGFKREHLGHDFMGQIGTPIIAVESGIIEAIGWNQYGGWRLGIRSFDKKRYYYYAHLRQNYPFADGLKEGSVVTAGDVIGYMGHTGYSQKENVNNIESVHLHYGVQLIFDESQKDCNSEIWINPYQLVRFLSKNRQEAVKVEGTKEWKRSFKIKDPIVEEYEKTDD